MPEWATVATIEASRWDAGTAYVVADAHRLDDDRPYLWQTTDYGKTWRSADARARPRRLPPRRARGHGAPRLLYLGTERGVVLLARRRRAAGSRSSSTCRRWRCTTWWSKGDDLVVGTTGRSIWVLDDLTPVREWTDAVAKSAVHLFPPRPATAWRIADAPFGSDAGGGLEPAGRRRRHLLAQGEAEGADQARGRSTPAARWCAR